MANIFKYPFFEFGSRYANSTEKSIIFGYKKLGMWFLYFYFFATLASMLFITSAVGAVTSGFFQNLFQTKGLGIINHVLLFCLTGIILSFGQYKFLDSFIKVIGCVLIISTILSFSLIIVKGPVNNQLFPILEYNKSDIFFIIALMGWMPTAVDLSTWNSLWTIERIKQTGYRPKLKETLFDFNFGYITSALLSICFVTILSGCIALRP